MSGINDSDVNKPIIKSEYTPEPTIEMVAQVSKKHKAVRTKKTDWASHDVEWYTDSQKKPIAYSTVATRDLITALAEENPNSTVEELKDLINYDIDAKEIVQQYVEAGYGNDIAEDVFINNEYWTEKAMTIMEYENPSLFRKLKKNKTLEQRIESLARMSLQRTEQMYKFLKERRPPKDQSTAEITTTEYENETTAMEIAESELVEMIMSMK